MMTIDNDQDQDIDKDAHDHDMSTPMCWGLRSVLYLLWCHSSVTWHDRTIFYQRCRKDAPVATANLSTRKWLHAARRHPKKLRVSHQPLLTGRKLRASLVPCGLCSHARRRLKAGSGATACGERSDGEEFALQSQAVMASLFLGACVLSFKPDVIFEQKNITLIMARCELSESKSDLNSSLYSQFN